MLTPMPLFRVAPLVSTVPLAVEVVSPTTVELVDELVLPSNPPRLLMMAPSPVFVPPEEVSNALGEISEAVILVTAIEFVFVFVELVAGLYTDDRDIEDVTEVPG